MFTTDLETTGTDDGTVQRGETAWFVTLTKQPGGAWRVINGGSRP